MKSQNKVIIIGAGFSSIAASCYLAKEGYDVSVYEKNSYLGGRARQLKKDGFTFDMGPSFYWMPDVFEKFFNDFGFSTSDFYKLHRLNPAYKVVFNHSESIDIEDSFHKIRNTFESIDPKSGERLQRFIDQAKDNYETAIQDLVYQPGEHLKEIITVKTAKKIGQFFSNIDRDSNSITQNEQLRQILKFPVLFLGAKPSKTPSFYNFMNYADFELGTWHPEGGMYSVVEAMVSLARKLGVKFYTHSEVSQIRIDHLGKAHSIIVNDDVIFGDIILCGADYHFGESLIPSHFRQYSEAYWKRKTFAPSSLLFYVGFDTKIPKINHHTLFFDADFELHAQEIYDTKKWPSSPLFYASFPSKTDPTVAPNDKDAGVFLIPLSIDLKDSEEKRNKYFDIIVDRLSKFCQIPIEKHILFKESFGTSDFISDYNSYGGNAYGLANTLLQTHILRPKLRSKKVPNLFFTGQLTVPGPGVPPSLISGNIVSDLIKKYYPLPQMQTTS